MDYLEHELPTNKAELRKYGLAKAVIDYIAYLTGNKYGIETIDTLYFTNLCNEFLLHPIKKRTIVLIPNDKADYSVSEIEGIIESGSFRLVLPMSLQVFYHLVRYGLVPNNSDDMKEFLRKAQPEKSFALQGAYVPAEQRAFVNVCGNIYYHHVVPVIPILHVKNYGRMMKKEPYQTSMKRAINNISSIMTEDNYAEER